MTDRWRPSPPALVSNVLAASVQVRLGSPGGPPFLHRPLLADPYGGRFDLRSWFMSRVLATAASQTADGANRHVLITNDLATQSDSRSIGLRVAKVPGVEIIQEGDDGFNATFPVEAFAAVARLVKPKRKRQLSPEQREAATNRLAKYAFSPARKAQSSELAGVQAA